MIKCSPEHVHEGLVVIARQAHSIPHHRDPFQCTPAQAGDDEHYTGLVQDVRARLLLEDKLALDDDIVPPHQCSAPDVGSGVHGAAGATVWLLRAGAVAQVRGPVVPLLAG